VAEIGPTANLPPSPVIRPPPVPDERDRNRHPPSGQKKSPPKPEKHDEDAPLDDAARENPPDDAQPGIDVYV